MSGFKSASSFKEDPLEALNEIVHCLEPGENAFTALFVSNLYDLEKLAPLIKKEFGDQVVACTTAGEVGTQGFQAHSFSAMALRNDATLSTVIPIENLDQFGFEDVKKIRTLVDLSRQSHRALLPNSKTFGILLIDGNSKREEEVTSMLATGIVDLEIVGGSAGYGNTFGETFVYFNGEFKSNRATLTLISTEIPFELFKSQHFVPSDKKLVITNSDPAQRIVYEIDGLPASEAYAFALGIHEEDLTPMAFSEHPLGLTVGNRYFIRSVLKKNKDKSLSFACAIETGLVLSLANRLSYFEESSKLFDNLQSKIGPLGGVLCFECILRRLEVLGKAPADRKAIDQMLIKNNAIGFHTYGEQYSGIHINQTLTGVAFGKAG